MLFQNLETLIGSVPSGYGDFVFIIGVVVLLYICDCFYGILRMLISHFLG